MSNFYTDDQLKELFDISKKDDHPEVSAQFHQRVQETLISLPSRKRRKGFVIPWIAVAILILSVTMAYARDIPIVSSVITFFKSHTALKDSKDTGVYERFSSSIDKTVENNGIRITIDNIACDDNYLVLFYTASGEGEKTMVGQGGVPIVQDVFGRFIVNGKKVRNIGTAGDSYITEDGRIKGILKADISKESFSDDLDINLKVFNVMSKEGEWEFTFKVSKAEAMKETKVVDVNKEYVIRSQDTEHHIKIEKVKLSPFGNSIVISEKFANTLPVEEQKPLMFFALYDDQGNSLDYVFPNGFSSNKEGARNSFEFIKGSKDIKFLKLIPVEPHFTREVTETSDPITSLENFPIELRVSSRGSIVVEKVELTDTATKIFYSRKGYIAHWGMSANDFIILDDQGNDAYQNRNPIQWDYVLDREKGIYVNVLPPLDKNKKYKLGCHKDRIYDFLDDQSITIPLKN